MTPNNPVDALRAPLISSVSPWRQSVEWIPALIRSVGTAFPATAFLVQLNSEIQANKVNQRLDHLEDPISSLHPDVKALSLKIYSALKGGASTHLAFADEFYGQFSRPLAALEANGYIKGGHAIGKRYAFGLNITSSSYILYMAALFESGCAIAKLVQVVDACRPNAHLDGNKQAAELGLPVPVVRAILELYRDKGYGLLSNEVGSNVYVAKV